MESQVFLGGSCAPTTWREDIAIPLLSVRGVRYFDPFVKDWNAECIPREAQAKAHSSVFLFVVDGATRSIASMIEIAEYAALRRRVVVCVEDIPDGQTIDGVLVTGRELKDLNRARAYLRDVINRYPGTAHLVDGIQAAVDLSAELCSLEIGSP